ncbi:MAG: glycosyltransferase [Planctomycetota bacterium]|nr:glycosyltransferase [Planctomycetota bacterium]
MSPRIAYWTSSFESHMEAVASEVALLRRHFRPSVSWGLSHHHWAMLSPRCGYCLHPKLHVLFRIATRVLQPLFEINHVFGSLGDWFYIQGSCRRPTVVTTAAQAPPVDKGLLDQVDRFVVEHPAGRAELQNLGIDANRIRLIFPPVDLQRFAPRKAADEDTFVVLFASSPDDATWLESRGIAALLDAAALCPDMTFRLLWRPWGNSRPLVERWIAQRGLRNVDVVVGRVEDMSIEYLRSHVTIAPFVERNHCKPAPNSLLESLACGRPVLCSPIVGIAEIVEREHCGVVSEPTGEAIAEGLRRLRGDWSDYSLAARQVAEKNFEEARFLSSYRAIYRELLAT